MKNLLTTLLILTASVSHAEPFTAQKPVHCAENQIVFGTIIQGLDETPMWVGEDKESKYILTENKKTKEWTMIQFNNEIACIIASGIKAKPVVTD